MDAHTVGRLASEGTALLPRPKVDVARDLAWNRRKLTSAVMQGVLQGESVPDVARRLRFVADMGRAASLRNARTAMTGAENGGRMDSYRRAEGMGIRLRKRWMAALDGRTRSSRRELDMVAVDNDEPFPNGCMFPGDPSGPACEVYNCRCTMAAAVDGVDNSDMPRRSGLGSMSYEEWKGEKAAEADAASRHKEANAGGRRYTPKSTIALSESHEALIELADKRGIIVAGNVGELDLTSAREAVAGMADVFDRYGVGSPMATVTTYTTKSSILADTDRWGTVRLNTASFKGTNSVAGITGAHEAAHVIEGYLSNWDEEAVDGAVFAGRVLDNARRAYNAAHEGSKIRTTNDFVSEANRGVAFRAIALEPDNKKRRNAYMRSEGLAESVEVIMSGNYEPGSVYQYIDEAIAAEVAKHG